MTMKTRSESSDWIVLTHEQSFTSSAVCMPTDVIWLQEDKKDKTGNYKDENGESREDLLKFWGEWPGEDTWPIFDASGYFDPRTGVRTNKMKRLR